MARTAKFTDDLLLDAVVQYADSFKGKIKATELAKWARKNVEGLEEVNDYNFTRPIKNGKTGKFEKKLCTQRIEELNLSRDIRKKENRNPLFSAVNIDQFFSLTEREQRNCVVQAREIVEEYKKTNVYLRRQHDYDKKMSPEIDERLNELEKKIKNIISKQAVLEKKLVAINKTATEENIRKKLEEIGITDGNFDLVKYNESLQLDIGDMLDIDKAIRLYQQEWRTLEGQEVNEYKKKELIDELTDF